MKKTFTFDPLTHPSDEGPIDNQIADFISGAVVEMLRVSYTEKTDIGVSMRRLPMTTNDFPSLTIEIYWL